MRAKAHCARRLLTELPLAPINWATLPKTPAVQVRRRQSAVRAGRAYQSVPSVSVEKRGLNQHLLENQEILGEDKLGTCTHTVVMCSSGGKSETVS